MCGPKKMHSLFRQSVKYIYIRTVPRTSLFVVDIGMTNISVDFGLQGTGRGWFVRSGALSTSIPMEESSWSFATCFLILGSKSQLLASCDCDKMRTVTRCIVDA